MAKSRAPKKLLPHFKVLRDQASVIASVYTTHKALIGKNKEISTRVHMLTPLLASIMSNTHAIAILVGSGHSNESYMLIRALYERCLNYCYLVIAPEEDFKRWFEHSLQKSYRLLRKELVVANFGFRLELKGHEEIWNTPEVAELMEKFQRRNSTLEKQNWSSVAKSRTDRIGWLSKAGKDIAWEPFVFVEAMFFDEASEALHGTFYGTVFHEGFFEPKFQEQSRLAGTHDASSLILSTTTVLLHTVIKAANLKLANPEALAKSIRLTRQAADILKSEVAKVDTKEIEPSKRILKVE
jgi:hypothetical protein